MKRYRHALTVSLLGWYLMLPPVVQRASLPWPDDKAPLSQWSVAESFDAAKDCEAAAEARRVKFQETYQKQNSGNPGEQFWMRFYLTAAMGATCIATDDPRLKEVAVDATPGKPKGTQDAPTHQE
jgi:hypothetical protein